MLSFVDATSLEEREREKVSACARAHVCVRQLPLCMPASFMRACGRACVRACVCVVSTNLTYVRACVVGMLCILRRERAAEVPGV